MTDTKIPCKNKVKQVMLHVYIFFYNIILTIVIPLCSNETSHNYPHSLHSLYTLPVKIALQHSVSGRHSQRRHLLASLQTINSSSLAKGRVQQLPSRPFCKRQANYWIWQLISKRYYQIHNTGIQYNMDLVKRLCTTHIHNNTPT